MSSKLPTRPYRPDPHRVTEARLGQAPINQGLHQLSPRSAHFPWAGSLGVAAAAV